MFIYSMSGTKENNETAKQTTNSSEDQNNLNKTGNVDETKITANEQAIRTHTKTIGNYMKLAVTL